MSANVSAGDVALSLCLVVVALLITRSRRVGVENDIVIATFRSAVQLVAVGFVLQYVFGNHGALTPLVLLVMIGTATATSGSRGRRVPGAYRIAAASVAVATAGTLGILILSRWRAPE